MQGANEWQSMIKIHRAQIQALDAQLEALARTDPPVATVQMLSCLASNQKFMAQMAGVLRIIAEHQERSQLIEPSNVVALTGLKRVTR